MRFISVEKQRSYFYLTVHKNNIIDLINYEGYTATTRYKTTFSFTLLFNTATSKLNKKVILNSLISPKSSRWSEQPTDVPAAARFGGLMLERRPANTRHTHPNVPGPESRATKSLKCACNERSSLFTATKQLPTQDNRSNSSSPHQACRMRREEQTHNLQTVQNQSLRRTP